MSDKVEVVTRTGHEPTLGGMLRSVARAELPARYYQLLQLAFPLAGEFVALHWWRPAGWAFAVGAFGAWALVEQYLQREMEFGTQRHAVARAARAVAGLAAGGTALLLALELFLRLLGSAPIS